MAAATHTNRYHSPIGDIVLQSEGGYLTLLDFADKHTEPKPMTGSDKTLTQARRWLDEYFAGHEPAALLPPMNLEGTPFQRAVWSLLLGIPYGVTTTYGELARLIAEEYGVEKMSARAVGQAVGHNPISLMVPCHRVVGAHGKLTGYGGGLERKKFLLTLEQRAVTMRGNADVRS